MTQKILGLDLGTSSIGTAIRNVDLGETLKDQMEYLSVDVFNQVSAKTRLENIHSQPSAQSIANQDACTKPEDGVYGQPSNS